MGFHSTMTSEENQKELQKLIREKFVKPLDSIKSFEELAEKTSLSLQTLRRFFGKIDTHKHIGTTSLSILCKYVGFRDFSDFMANYEIQNELSEKDKSFIKDMSVFFRNGEHYNIDYHQNTIIVDTLNDYAVVIHKKKKSDFFLPMLSQISLVFQLFLGLVTEL